MKRWIPFVWSMCFIALFTFIALPGCQPGKGAKKEDPKKDKGHDHDETGPHGGPLAEWEDIYHAEFTVDHAKKQVVVYILDDKAKAAPKIDAGKITKVKLNVKDIKPPLQIDLTHDAQLSGDKGIAFTATHDHFQKPADVKGNIQ